MRLIPAVRESHKAAHLCALLVVPVAAVTPAVAADMNDVLTTVWVPVCAYGLMLLTALSGLLK